MFVTYKNVQLFMLI